MNLSDVIKRALVGTSCGRLAESVRDQFQLLGASKSSIGCIANDLLARDLVVGLGARRQCFVDIGAHIGSCGGAVLSASRETSVTFIEAMPNKAAFLRRKFPGATVHECAVGDYEGQVEFYVNLQASGYSSLAASRASTCIQVDMHRVDNLCKVGDVIKIDVEGAELGVLKGATALVLTQRPVVLFESAPGAGERLGFTLPDMYGWWALIDYEIVVPNRLAHDGPSLRLEGYLESHEYPRRCTNYFAVPAEKRQSVRDEARLLLGL